MRYLLTSVAVFVAMMGVDLLWLGLIARRFYDEALGPLKRVPIYWPAAVIFYLFYVCAIVSLAVVPATSSMDALKRGAILGGVCYATYELTNWAVLAKWPALLVPVDIAWGVVLTATVSLAGYLVWERIG